MAARKRSVQLSPVEPLTADRELDRQIAVLLAKDYPALAAMSERDFLARIEPLRSALAKLEGCGEGNLPFVLVVKAEVVPTVAAVERIEIRGKPGWTDMQSELADYRTIEGVEVPAAPVYAIADVSTGPETLDVAPRDALPMIRGAGRQPLTIDEGVAMLTQFPELLRERNAFQALASRAGNKRIPSFWMSKGAPRLGWCWEGNPHTWLGAGSAATRLGGR